MRKIGVCAWVMPQKKEELFTLAANMGLAAISPEYALPPDASIEDVHAWEKELHGLAARHHIELPIVGVNTLGAYGMSKKERFPQVKQCLDLAIPAATEAGALAVHLPSFGPGEIHTGPELEQTIRCLEYALALGERYSIGIGHEAVLPPEWYDVILHYLSSPKFFMLYDNENLSKHRYDEAKIYHRYCESYRHAHIKSSNAATGMPEPLGISAEPALDALAAHGFSGWLLLETDYKRLTDRSIQTNMLRGDIQFLLSR